MTASDALDAANDAEPGERLRRYETICGGPRGGCRREALANDAGRWTWCPDCLTVYDDYGKAVSRIREFPLHRRGL